MTFSQYNTRLSSASGIPRRGRNADGFSMTEMVVVISIIGILSTILVGSFGQFLDGAKDVAATERQEMLNQAVHRFAQQHDELVWTAISSSTVDETTVLLKLQYRNPNEDLATIGSPYMDPRYNPVASSSDATYRLRWTGSRFELLKPGKAGTGLLMNFEGTDFTSPVKFPPGFDPSGR